MAAQTRDDRPHRIAILALDELVAYDLGGPIQVFGTARNPRDRRRCYDVAVTTPDGGPVRTEGGFSIQPDRGPDLLDTAETVVVPGISGSTLVEGWVLDPAVADLLRGLADRGVRLMSTCTGAFVLAAAGLLDGRPATTHWFYADRFRRWFPKVDLDPNVLFVDDGDVLTSAGVAAGLDLCLHVVRRDRGTEVANYTARRCVVPPWREGGQAQFIERPVPDPDHATTAPTRHWLLDRLGEPVDLAAMAAHACMSVRTFTRRFREETGMSAGDWLIAQRISRARHLLEATDLSVDQVARESGFGTTASLRQQLRAAIGVTPMSYRRTFRPDSRPDSRLESPESTESPRTPVPTP